MNIYKVQFCELVDPDSSVGGGRIGRCMTYVTASDPFRVQEVVARDCASGRQPDFLAKCVPTVVEMIPCPGPGEAYLSVSVGAPVSGASFLVLCSRTATPVEAIREAFRGSSFEYLIDMGAFRFRVIDTTREGTW